MRPKVEEWSHRVHTLAKIVKRYHQSEYAILGMALQIEWQYLQKTVPGVVTLMAYIEDTLREAFLSALLGGEEVSAKFR